jgi:hypothetical protein
MIFVDFTEIYRRMEPTCVGLELLLSAGSVWTVDVWARGTLCLANSKTSLTHSLFFLPFQFTVASSREKDTAEYCMKT